MLLTSLSPFPSFLAQAASPFFSPTVVASVKRLDHAQSRFLAANKTLATVRKLLKPSLSVLDMLGGPSRESGRERGAGRRMTTNPAKGVPVTN
jgi:hypothetical protein